MDESMFSHLMRENDVFQGEECLSGEQKLTVYKSIRMSEQLFTS